jgi:hypothetical protein
LLNALWGIVLNALWGVALERPRRGHSSGRANPAPSHAVHSILIDPLAPDPWHVSHTTQLSGGDAARSRAASVENRLTVQVATLDLLSSSAVGSASGGNCPRASWWRRKTDASRSNAAVSASPARSGNVASLCSSVGSGSSGPS